MQGPHDASARAAPSTDAINALRDAAQRLDVEEILDLCYARTPDPLRLTVYAEALRRKGGSRAQAAACLICFDLASRGLTRFQAELGILLPVVSVLDAPRDDGPTTLERLIGDHVYLQQLLGALRAHILDADAALAAAEAIELLVDEEDTLEVTLLDDDDLAEIEAFDDEVFAAPPVDAALLAGFQAALERFLGPAELAKASRGALVGFATGARPLGQDPREELAASLEGLAPHLALAREMQFLAELALSVELKPRGLFGRRSRNRDRRLHTALTAFVALDSPPQGLASWFEWPTATPDAWPKVAAVLLDFTAFLGGLPPGSAPQQMPSSGFADAYLASDPADVPRMLNALTPGRARPAG